MALVPKNKPRERGRIYEDGERPDGSNRVAGRMAGVYEIDADGQDDC